MRERAARLAACAVLVILSLPVPLLQAQQAESTLSGKVTDSSGAAVPNAKVSVRNVETGRAAEIQTDETGAYDLPKLAPGDYEVTVSVNGFTVKTDKVTLPAGDRVGGHVHQCGWQEHQQYGPNGAHGFGFRNGGLVLYDRILCDPRAARIGNEIPGSDSLS